MGGNRGSFLDQAVGNQVGTVVCTVGAKLYTCVNIKWYVCVPSGPIASIASGDTGRLTLLHSLNGGPPVTGNSEFVH